VTSSEVVSNGSTLPTGLNGSRTLSPPAATVTPAASSLRTAGRPRGTGAADSALQVQVRDRQRHHGEAGVAHLGEHVGQRGGVQGTQAHAMAGGDPLGEAARADLPGQLADGEHAGIELLVGVQVDVDTAALGEAQQPGELLERVVGQVRAATEHVHAEVQRALQGGGVGDAAGQQADLQVEHVTQLLAQPEHGAHAAQRVVGVQRQVDVAAYRRDAGGQVPGQRVPGPAVDVLGGEPPGVVAPGVDGRGQVAVRGVAGRPAERLVQVGVRLDGRGEQHPAGQRQLAHADRGRAGRAYLGDHPVRVEEHVHRVAGRGAHPAQPRDGRADRRCTHRGCSPGAVKIVTPARSCR
jgi:hypothetical protein